MTATPSLAQRQFRLPTGWFGRLAGWFMSAENQRMNRMAVDWLDAGPGDDVLEIGFGPGHGIELLVERTAARLICGVDASPVMVEQATARSRKAVDEGRVRLSVASIESLPYRDGQFSRVLAVSNFHVWPSRTQGLAEVYRVLTAGGLLVICMRRALRSPWPWSSPGVSSKRLHDDQKLLEGQGFRQVQMATRKVRRTNVCLIARK